MHGWINLYKPEGITSAKAVAKVKRALGVKKIGHTGTLDPLACGVLPLAIGEATKLSDYVMAERKDYTFTVQWGIQTTTDDREGEISHRSDHRPSLAEINAILPEFTGTIMQRPPIFSAIKQDGKRAYAQARAGKTVEIPARAVQVYSLKPLPPCGGVKSGADGFGGGFCDIEPLPPTKSSDEDLTPPQGGSGKPEEHTTFTLSCGKGTYIRSIARDMGQKLGCYGSITYLERTQTGFFAARDAISLDVITDLDYTPQSESKVIPMDVPLDDIPAVHFTADQTLRLSQGKWAHPLEAGSEFCHMSLLRCYDNAGQFFALGLPVGHYVKARRVFNI